MRSRAQGQAFVEFGLILPVLLVLVLGMIDLGRAFVFGVAVQQGAREAARLGAKAALDPTIDDTTVLGRLIAASDPALVGCSATQTQGQACSGGNWTLTIEVTPATGSPIYSSVATARAAGLSVLRGAQLHVRARGSVSLFVGFLTGAMGLGLNQVTVEGDARMVVF
jgi:Flp pilus assembly protein TadG